MTPSSLAVGRRAKARVYPETESAGRRHHLGAVGEDLPAEPHQDLDSFRVRARGGLIDHEHPRVDQVLHRVPEDLQRTALLYAGSATDTQAGRSGTYQVEVVRPRAS